MRKLPTSMKERQGTLAKSRVLPDEVEYSSIERVEMPHWWPPDIQGIYQVYVEELRRVKLLFKTDLSVLQRFCFAIWQAQEAEKHLADEGFVLIKITVKGVEYEALSEWVTILKNANLTIQSISAKFGFSPVDKTRVALSVRKPDLEKKSLLK